MVATRRPKAELDIAPTVARLDEIAKHLIETGEKAREERDFSNAIGAFVQATNVAVTAHQIQERHLYMQAEADGESQPPGGSGGLRGRYPIGGLEDEGEG